MSNYTKLFASIIHSSVWQLDRHVKLVWVTMLAMKNRDGIVEASVPGIAAAAGVSLPEAEQALALFMAPDPHSRTETDSGRRVRKVPGGWFVINHDEYNDRSSADDYKAKNAARQARLRASRAARASSSAEASNVTSNAVARHVAPGHTLSRSVTTSTDTILCSTAAAAERPTQSQNECAFGDVADGGMNPEEPATIPGWNPQRLAVVLSECRRLVGGGPYGYRQAAWQALHDACAVFSEANPDDPADAARWAFAAWARTKWASDAQWPVAAFLADAGKHLA